MKTNENRTYPLTYSRVGTSIVVFGHHVVRWIHATADALVSAGPGRLGPHVVSLTLCLIMTDTVSHHLFTLSHSPKAKHTSSATRTRSYQDAGAYSRRRDEATLDFG